MCHAADDADSGGRERISAARKLAVAPVRLKTAVKGLPLKTERKNTRRREMERTSPDGRK